MEKYCNCKKSNCLKLYCECFACGTACTPSKCNCFGCYNNDIYATERQSAVSAVLERNPNAFKSKISVVTLPKHEIPVTLHQKGCHCKKSNCLKK